MEVNFEKKDNRQQIMIFVFVAVILVTLFVLWDNYGRKIKIPDNTSEQTTYIPKKIEIDFDFLKNPVLKELQPYEEIQPLEDEAGRENPFIVY